MAHLKGRLHVLTHFGVSAVSTCVLETQHNPVQYHIVIDDCTIWGVWDFILMLL